MKVARLLTSPSVVNLQGSFADANYLSGTYLADAEGNFQAVGDANVAAIYRFIGSYTSTPNDSASGGPVSAPINFEMDASNQVSGWNSRLVGTVSGNTFTGTVRLGGHGRPTVTVPVSGTYTNTASGVTLGGAVQFGYFGSHVLDGRLQSELSMWHERGIPSGDGRRSQCASSVYCSACCGELAVAVAIHRRRRRPPSHTTGHVPFPRSSARRSR